MNKSKKTENCGENKQKKPPLGTVLFAVGALLLALALVFTVTWAVSEVNYRKKSPQILSELDSLLPEVKKGSPDDRVNTSHAMVDIDGESFIGIIELPAYNTRLPVGSSWGKSSLKAYPSRYLGSLYDGSLTVGGSYSDGQFDFMDSVTEWDSVFFTDVTGKRYSFEVSEVLIDDSINEAEWQKDASLVLFARRDGKYTVVKCNIA